MKSLLRSGSKGRKPVTKSTKVSGSGFGDTVAREFGCHDPQVEVFVQCGSRLIRIASPEGKPSQLTRPVSPQGPRPEKKASTMFVPETEPGPVTPIVQCWKKGPPSQPKMLSFEGATSEKVKLVHVNPVLFRMSNTPPPSLSTCRPNEPPVTMMHGFVVLQVGSRRMMVGSMGAEVA